MYLLMAGQRITDVLKMKNQLLTIAAIILLSCGQNKTEKQANTTSTDTASTTIDTKKTEKRPLTGKITTIADGYDVKRVNLFTSTSPDRTITCFLKNGEKVKILLDADPYYFVEQANGQGCRGYCMKSFVLIDKWD
jgi:hypothetical protein